MSKIIKRIGKFKLILAIICVLAAGGAYAMKNDVFSGDKEEKQEEKIVKSVKTVIIDPDAQNNEVIETVGSVEPEAKVSVVALGKGTVKAIDFKIGDDVYLNQVLASMYSGAVLTNYTSSQINYANMQNNLASIERVADEAIRQAELGVKNAEESVMSAEISLKTARDNFDNSSALREKSNKDTIDNAIISFSDYLNFVDSTLDSVNYIINAENGAQIAGIEETISVKNKQSLNDAKMFYVGVRESYNNLILVNPTSQSIEQDMNDIVSILSDLSLVVNYTVDVLDNTISSTSFNQDLLSAQRNNFSSIRSSVVATKNRAEGTVNGLENLSLADDSQNDALQNAVESAKNRLNLAKLGLDNSNVALESAHAAKEQQLASARTSLDGAEGQLNLTETQVSDLTIKAPINGKITGKFVELGAEVNPGQKIAEISQIGNVKIKVSLTSEDIYRIKLGQIVYLGEEKLEARITSIDPVADPVTKKVNIEILFDNKNNKLIPGTFLDVEIPVEELEKTDETSVYVPLRSVNITQNESFVFIVVNNVAEKRIVKTKRTQGALIEIVSGLNSGDELVIDGSKSLEGGETVEIKN